MSEGAKPQDRYEVGKILSSGMIGIVYLVRDRTGIIPEFKVVKRMSVAKIIEKRLAESLRQELLILREVSGIEHCIRLIDHFHDKENISLVFPFYPKKDLYHFARVRTDRPMHEFHAQRLFKQLITVLGELH